MTRWTARPDLSACLLHGPESGAELFVVEGRSAADAVRAVRDPVRQAVLPLQGKPLNGARATAARVAADPFLGALAAALGTGWGDACSLDGLRYERVLLLHDPDADGIHIGALLLMHVARWLAPLLEAGRVERVHAPVGEVRGGRGAAVADEPSAHLWREFWAAWRAARRALPNIWSTALPPLPFFFFVRRFRESGARLPCSRPAHDRSGARPSAR